MKKNEKETKKKSWLKPRHGEKTYDYVAMSFRYWCGECREEVEQDGKCHNCGTRTTSFSYIGIL